MKDKNKQKNNTEFNQDEIIEMDKRAVLIGKADTYSSEEILKEFGYFSLKDELVKTHLLNAENNETPEETESFFLTPLKQDEIGLSMCVHLRCIPNKGEPPFLRFQNDRSKQFNSNWVKIYIDGQINNYENKKLVFTQSELNDLKDWINLNKEPITKHYYKVYSSLEVCHRLRKFK